MLKDSMVGFELFQPTDIDAAIELLERFGSRGWALAGGYDSLDRFKDRTATPEAVVDLEGIDELRGVRETDGGLEIGAMTTLADVAASPSVRSDFGLLADAAEAVASPQIRNAATLGGNLCQDARCWYYRYGVKCYRAGGNTCYAAAPDAMNREHAIFGASRCVAVSPSDTAAAIVALDAEMVVRGSGGERTIPAEHFFMEPAVDIMRMTVLDSGEILVSVRLPDRWRGADFRFEKVTDRNSWDFALVSVAAAFRMAGPVVDEARIVAGAVQCIPRRLTRVERFLRGATRNEAVAEEAGALAVDGAETLAYNHFKVPLTQNLVTRAVRSA